MEGNVFDRVARDYEALHNKSLPPGVRSDEFVAYKSEKVIRWIEEGYRGPAFRYLDFGCGNGRLFRYLTGSDRMKGLLDKGTLRLFGVDTSAESIREAKAVAGDERILFAKDLSRLPADASFDLVTCFNVFHHIPPAERGTAVQALRARMKPGSRLVVWEHNPYNPFSKMLVRICPFDRGARLLSQSGARALFGRELRYLDHAYVHLFPPKLRELDFFSVVEEKLSRAPVGAQYWAMFQAF